jgi:hypothetical protein
MNPSLLLFQTLANQQHNSYDFGGEVADINNSLHTTHFGRLMWLRDAGRIYCAEIWGRRGTHYWDNLDASFHFNWITESEGSVRGGQ